MSNSMRNKIKRIYRSEGINGLLKATFIKVFKSSKYSPDFKKIARDVTDHLAISNQTNPEVYKRLSEGVYYVFGMGVEGDIAEFGTMSGRTAVALSAAINYCNDALIASDKLHGFSGERKLWLFDSFEDLPSASTSIDKNSLHVASGIWGRGTCLGMSADALLNLTSSFLSKSKIIIVKGWFKDTVPNIPSDKKFSMLHIDGDLYESAIDVLDSLFSRNMISKGAQIFFDDWNCNAADPNFGERLAWQEMIVKYNIIHSDEGSYGTVSHRFIVHNYHSI